MKRLVLLFGRFNPPTRGHEELFRIATGIAAKRQARLVVFVSHTQNAENPLSYDEKVRLIKKSMPELVIGPRSVMAPTGALAWAKQQQYTDVLLLCGQDRVENFSQLVNSWQSNNDADHNMTIKVQATPRHQNVMSGSIARRLARRGLVDKFARILISGTSPNDAARIATTIKQRLGSLDELMNHIKGFRKWLAEAGPERPLPPSQRGMGGGPMPMGPGGDDPMSAPPIPKEPQVRPPFPIGSTETDGRVPADSKADQAVLVLHPDVRLRFDLRNKVNRMRQTRQTTKPVPTI